jgi:hypothetical protein
VRATFEHPSIRAHSHLNYAQQHAVPMALRATFEHPSIRAHSHLNYVL